MSRVGQQQETKLRTPGISGTADAVRKLTRPPHDLPRHTQNEPRHLQLP